MDEWAQNFKHALEEKKRERPTFQKAYAWITSKEQTSNFDGWIFKCTNYQEKIGQKRKQKI